jgi:hypothetical protein
LVFIVVLDDAEFKATGRHQCANSGALANLCGTEMNCKIRDIYDVVYVQIDVARRDAFLNTLHAQVRVTRSGKQRCKFSKLSTWW